MNFMDSLQKQFCDLLADKGIHLQESQLQQFEIYYKELIDWNERMNLTGITEREQVYIKHFYDSLSVSFFVPMKEHVFIADIGSGAGFPSIPLKIVFPHLKVTIIDSLNKRIQFLNHVTSALSLKDVNCIHGRAEDIARQVRHRDHYDLVTARAVARLAVLNEFCLPFVSVGGFFVAMKGNEIQEEVIESAYSVKELKAECIHIHQFRLPVEESNRNIIVIKKMDRTPKKYPRKAGIPLKSPLI